MPPALTFLTRSLAAAGSGGRRNLAWACLALLHLCGARRPALVRGRLRLADRLCPGLGCSEFLVARRAAAAAGRRGAVAVAGRDHRPAVAVQARHAADDDQLPRHHDHRCRHGFVPADGLSQSRLDDRGEHAPLCCRWSCCCGGSIRLRVRLPAALSARRPASRACARCRSPCRAISTKTFANDQLRVAVRALRRNRRGRSLRPAAISNPTRP